MYDINFNNFKKIKRDYSIILIVGLFLFASLAGTIFKRYGAKYKYDSVAISSSVDVESYVDPEEDILYYGTYHFEVDERSYTCKTKDASSFYPKEGKKVYYDSNNPQMCEVEPSSGIDALMIVVAILPIMILIVAIGNISKVSKKIKMVKELNKYGKLVKKLPYELKETGVIIAGNKIYELEVEYKLDNGSIVTLKSEHRHDGVLGDTVDILIDENNTSKYYIDFEINRLSGNLQSDYYKGE